MEERGERMGPVAGRKRSFVFTGLLVAAAAAVVVTANGKKHESSRQTDRLRPSAEGS